MTEAELQAIEARANDSFRTRVVRGTGESLYQIPVLQPIPAADVRALVAEIRSLRTQLSSPSEELVEAVAFDIFCAHSIPPKTGNDALAQWAAENNIGRLFFAEMA